MGDNIHGINSPDFKGASPKIRTRSVKDAGQAAVIWRTLSQENNTRNLKNARIMAKYNSERPYSQEQLEAEGLSWKANFSSKVLSTLIDKVSPRFTRAVDMIRFFTSSKLPDSVPGAVDKTEAFQKEITSTIRAWTGWRSLMAEIAQENALFGYTCAGFTNEYTWKPKHFRQDHFNCPVGTKQIAGGAQIITFKETLLPHELFELLSDPEAARDAGWDLENALQAINSALPETVQSKANEWARLYEDLQRESSVGVSHTGAKVILLGHVLAQEVDGKVSHYIIDTRKVGDGKGGESELFVREDRFDSMEDVAAFFSFQQANGTLHGSKGIGREVYAMAGVIERARNEVVDGLQLSGKVVLQADEKMLHRFKAHVVGPALLIDSAFTVADRKIESNVKEYFQLDTYMKQLLDEVAGNTSPKPMDSPGDGMRSPAAWNLLAAREEENKDVVIERFLNQFSVMISMIQKRMCDPRCEDEDAKEMQKRLLLLMKREELEQLAKQPSAGVVRDFTEFERMQIITIAAENKGNPLYNQKELERRSLMARVSADFADAVLMPSNDPTEEAEQSRQQQLELGPLQAAQPVPVSPRDNHEIHLTLLQPVIEGAMKVLATNPQALPVVKAMLAHGQEHVKVALQQKNPAVNVSGFAAFLAEVANRLTQLAAHDQAIEAAVASGDPVAAVNAGATAARGVAQESSPAAADPTQEFEQPAALAS
jgi:hypothetical protein